jgi:hypothetical protein
MLSTSGLSWWEGGLDIWIEGAGQRGQSVLFVTNTDTRIYVYLIRCHAMQRFVHTSRATLLSSFIDTLQHSYCEDYTTHGPTMPYLFFPPPNPPKPIICAISTSPSPPTCSPASTLFLSSLFRFRSSFLASFSCLSASFTAVRRVLKSKLAAVVLCLVSSRSLAIRALTWERVERSVRFVCPRLRRSVWLVYVLVVLHSHVRRKCTYDIRN